MQTYTKKFIPCYERKGVFGFLVIFSVNMVYDFTDFAYKFAP